MDRPELLLLPARDRTSAPAARPAPVDDRAL